MLRAEPVDSFQLCFAETPIEELEVILQVLELPRVHTHGDAPLDDPSQRHLLRAPASALLTDRSELSERGAAQSPSGPSQWPPRLQQDTTLAMRSADLRVRIAVCGRIGDLIQLRPELCLRIGEDEIELLWREVGDPQRAHASRLLRVLECTPLTTDRLAVRRWILEQEHVELFDLTALQGAHTLAGRPVGHSAGHSAATQPVTQLVTQRVSKS